MMVVRTDTRATLLHEPTTTTSRRSDLFGHWCVLRGIQHARIWFPRAPLPQSSPARAVRARHKVDCEVWVTVTYKGEELGKQRLDVVVDDCIVIEIKSTHDLQKNATRQL